MDLLGTLLRKTPSFRGKWRLQRFWQSTIQYPCRIAYLPSGLSVEANLTIPYERQVWLEAEEWNEMIFLRHLLSAGDVFIDVGANIGLWTLTAAAAVGPDGHVFSFEPNPFTFAKLERNVARNSLKDRITIYPWAVSSEVGLSQFICKAEHNVSHLATLGENSDAISVKMITLDSLFDTIPVHKKIIGIKIDTEGHEIQTLQGCDRIIRHYAPWLIVEFNTTLLPSKKIMDWGVYNYLIAKGYNPWTYAKKKLCPVPTDFTISGYTNIFFKR